MVYSDVLRDHIERPRNVGELASPALVAEVTNNACGDCIRLSLLVEADRIVTARMKAYGCAPTLAAASALTELLTGSTVTAALAMESEAIVAALQGLPRGKRHAAELAIEALHAALAQL